MAGRALGSVTADVPTISAPFSSSDPGPGLCSKHRAQLRELRCLSRLTDRISALLQFRAGVAVALQKGDLVEGHEALLGLGMQRGWQVVTHGRLSALL